MSLSQTPSLISIKTKLDRAKEHLEEIAGIDKQFSEVQCDLVFKKDYDKGIGFFALSP